VRSAILNKLKGLHIARAALVKDRTAAKNCAEQIRLGLLKRQNEARLKQIGRQLKAVDAAILALIRSDSTHEERYNILVSIPGIAAVTDATDTLGRRNPPESHARPFIWCTDELDTSLLEDSL
jgi:transposase